jgi:hypothetical protein
MQRLTEWNQRNSSPLANNVINEKVQSAFRLEDPYKWQFTNEPEDANSEKQPVHTEAWSDESLLAEIRSDYVNHFYPADSLYYVLLGCYQLRLSENSESLCGSILRVAIRGIRLRP